MLFSESGGLTYHYLAWRYQRLWVPFRSMVALWLREWKTSTTKNLLLIGPSGGYSLSNEFLNRFSTIKVYDPDFVAKHIFHKRLGIKTEWKHADALGTDDLTPERLKDTLQKHPDHTVLFCNLLGQVPFLLKNYSEKQIEDYFLKISDIIQKESAHRPIGSYHDVYSQTLKGADSHILRDHMTSELFPKSWRKDTYKWMRTPREEHTIGWAHST